MGIVLDLIIVAIIVLCVLLAAKKGFVKSIFNIAGFVAAIVLSLTFSGPIADFVYNKTVEPIVVDVVQDMVKDSGEIVSEEIFSKLPAFIRNAAETLNVNKDKLNVTGDALTVAENISNELVKPIAVSVIKAIVSIILIVVLSIVFKFLAKFLNKLFSFSIVGKLNRTLGGVLGAVQGTTIVIIFVLVVNIIISFTGGFFCFTGEAAEASYIFKQIAGLLN